jgi:hypothetical protein
MSDPELRLELKKLYEQATKVWSLLNDRNKRSEGFANRRKLVNRAWKLNNMAWELYRDVIKEYDGT